MAVPAADQIRLSHILADDLQPRIQYFYDLEQQIAILSGGGLTSWGLVSTAQFHGNGDPNGNVTAIAEGDLYIDETGTPGLWIANGAGTVWTAVGSGGGGAVASVNGFTGVVVLGATDVGAQPVDSDLTAIAALTTTSFGRAFLTLADAAAGRTYLGLGTAATNNTGDFDAAGAAAAAQAASQPLDSDLTAIAGLTATTDNVIQSVGGAWASRTPAQVRTALGLVIGTNVQAFDADLTTYAGITPGALGQAILPMTTLTNHGLVLGAGASAPTALTPDAGTTKFLKNSVASDAPTWQTIAESDVTNLSTDLTDLQTQNALQAAQLAAALAAALGYYVGQGCFYSPNGTPTKLDVTAGTALFGPVEVKCTAQTAINTTIASLADATNPKWVAVEINSAGTTTFNQGTAAASPAFPTPTASVVVAAWIYVPANATNVDTLLTTNNGLAKLYDARVLRPGPSVAGWSYDQNTWTFVSSTTGAGGGLITFKLSGVDATGYLTPGTKVSWDDATNTAGYGVIATSAFSTDTTITLIKQSDYVMANHAIIYPRYSRKMSPVGFPAYFNWSPTLAGWASAGGTDPTNVAYTWWQTGPREITITVRQATNGTSGSVTHTATLPVTAATLTSQVWATLCNAVDNNVTQAGIISVVSAATTVTLAGILATANNTASGNSRLGAGQVQYVF